MQRELAASRDYLQSIVQELEAANEELQSANQRQGRWYSLRIRPDKSLDNKIDDAVIALFDIDALKRAESEETGAMPAS